MPRFSITRALVIVAVLVLVAIAYSALATTWVAWVPVQTSAGTSATFNYWGGDTFMYSTQSVTWITPPMNTLGSATYDQIQNYLGSSGAALWIAFSSGSTSSNYMYQGTVAATATVGIGSSYTFSTAYNDFAAFAVIDVTSEKCGQLYFHADISTGTAATYYGVYMFGNATWFYVTFYSGSAGSSTLYAPSVSGPNTCLSPGYYLYVVTIYATVAQSTVKTAQVSIGTTSEGTSTVPGTQYALNIAPASGDSMVFPWTTSASPYVKLMFTQTVVNTAGSTTTGSFNIVISGTTYSLSNIDYILYFSDSATNTFPSGQVTPTNCPSNVYELTATVSSSVSKLLSCQSLSSPSSGVAVYPGDYAKYSSSATVFIPFSIPSGASASASFSVSYTDSASNTYSVSTPYGFQPTNPSISSSNTQGYLAQLPQCSISSNPYGGATGTFGLLNCVAIDYGAISAVVWFYEPNGGQGVLLSFQNNQYGVGTPYAYTPWLYVGTNGYLYAGDWAGSNRLVSTSSAISPGWHMAVVEEYYSGGTYYLALYLDGSLVGQLSLSSLPQLFGANSPYPYNDIGTGFTNSWTSTNGGWFFFNGTIAYVAVYNTALSQSQVQQLYSTGFPNTLFSNNLVAAYYLSPNYYNGNGYYFVPYYVNSQIMSQMGISNADATSITPSGSVGAIPSSQFVTSQASVYISSFSITPSTSYADYVHNPSITAGNTYYIPAPNSGWAYVGPGLLSSPSVSGSTNVTVSLLGKPGISNYPTVTINGTALRMPFSSSTTSYTIVFYQLSGDTETIGVTPNGLGVYFLSSNTTTYAIPSTPHQSTLTIPTTTGVYIGQSLGDWWNVTNKPYYNLTLINGAGSTGSFSIKVNGATNTASQFAWNLNNPPNAIVYFTGTDGYTYAFNPAWVQDFGITQALVGSSIYFVPTVVGETLTSTNLAFISQGVWLNETTVNNSFMTYYPLPSFINFLSTPIMMYVNNTVSPRYLTPALAIINNNLQQYTVQYMNITAWSNNGALMGVAIIQTPFSFIGFVSNGSLAPIWILLNSTVGVPPILFSYYPQIRYLLMPDTASVPYTLVTIYVNVPSQLFNQWSGNLVFGVSQAMSNGYFALVSGGFYAPPPTQFSLYVPTYLLNKLAQLFLASYPLSTTCTMLQVLSNPLETTICQGISQVVTVNLGNTQVGKPAFGDVAGAFNIAPLTKSLTLEQVIAINAATAALVILFIKKHQSLPAGLMLGGAIALALGVFLWLEMEIGIGILLFVAGAALATTHRTQ